MVKLTGVCKLMHSIDSDKRVCETSRNLTRDTASPYVSKAFHIFFQACYSTVCLRGGHSYLSPVTL